MCEALQPTELFLWQLCGQYARQYPDARHPIKSELVAAFVPRVVRLLLLPQVLAGVASASHELPSELRSTSWTEAAEQLKCAELVSQIVELDSWLHEAGIDEFGCGNWLTGQGYTFEQASASMKRARRYETGRRPTKRQIAVRALEAKRLDESRTWRTLAEEFCGCGKLAHGDLCLDSLRHSVRELKAVLKKYTDYSVPAEGIAPLANFFLDRMGWKNTST